MIKFLLVLALELLWLATATAGESMPERFQKSNNLDQQHNIGVGMFLSKPSQTVPVYHWDIPVQKGSDINVYQAHSSYMTPEDWKFVSGGPPPQSEAAPATVRVFFVDTKLPIFEELRQIYGEPQQDYLASKMQSHTTHFVWDKTGYDNQNYFIKFDTFQGTVSVANNDLIQDSLRAQPDPLIAMLPEIFTVSISGKKGSYSTIVRTTAVFAGDPGSHYDWQHIYPLHGLLGSATDLDEIEKVYGAFQAREGNHGQKNWIQQEYLPKLAAFVATLNLRHGILSQAHTQNLLIELNPDTGEIKNFIFRDLRDVVFDPHTIKITDNVNGRKMLNSFLTSLDGIPATVNSVMAGYLAQAVLNFETNHYLRQENAAIFLNAYLDAAQVLTGRRIKLSRQSQRALKALEHFEVANEGLTSHMSGKLQQIIGSVSREIYEQFQRAKATPAENSGGLKARLQSLCRWWLSL